MHNERLAAFSDGVIAIIITIMVLELKQPHGVNSDALIALLPVFLSYVLSFIYVAIYWNNHHHLLMASGQVSASILWANMHLLFWLSLIPFATEWVGENHMETLPVALYGVVLLMAAVSYFLLQIAIIRTNGPGSILARALGRDVKGKLSILLYFVAIASAFFSPLLSVCLYILVAISWIVPDRRIEHLIVSGDSKVG